MTNLKVPSILNLKKKSEPDSIQGPYKAIALGPNLISWQHWAG